MVKFYQEDDRDGPSNRRRHSGPTTGAIRDFSDRDGRYPSVTHIAITWPVIGRRDIRASTIDPTQQAISMSTSSKS
jgi:hypothetical protein